MIADRVRRLLMLLATALLFLMGLLPIVYFASRKGVFETLTGMESFTAGAWALGVAFWPSLPLGLSPRRSETGEGARPRRSAWLRSRVSGVILRKAALSTVWKVRSGFQLGYHRAELWRKLNKPQALLIHSGEATAAS
jgi:hypothetical protein